MSRRVSLPALLALVLLAAPPVQAARVTVPGTTVSLDVPAGFVPMPQAVIASKYSRGSQPPTAVYSTPGPHWEVNIAFAVRDVALPAGDLAPVQASLERSVSSTPGLRWVSRGVVKSAGRDWVDLRFWVNGIDTPIYNHLRVTREGHKTLLVSVNVTQKLYAKYSPQIEAAMSSLK